MIDIRVGDCLDTLRAMADNSVDSIVTDPPYGLEFMGQGWDSDVPPVSIWAECLRVLKPGGHLLAFAGTRTQHRMATRIEDAGFEIRDLIAWVYGSGFPKSLDVSKAIDREAGAKREVVGQRTDGRYAYGFSPETAWHGRETFGQGVKGVLTAPATDAARQWDGWGTALKPALEPVTVARKPLGKGLTIAANVLTHGTGALNIDGARVPTDDKLSGGHSTSGQQMTGGWERPWMSDPDAVAANAERSRHAAAKAESLGRWPANLITDGSDEVTALFPETATHGGGNRRANGSRGGIMAAGFEPMDVRLPANSGSAARFFYAAKASRSERGEGNNHPTVKPISLMRYLVRLVTPPGGVVLDPFAGSGTTGLAAQAEGMRAILCELNPDYAAIIAARIAAE